VRGKSANVCRTQENYQEQVEFSFCFVFFWLLFVFGGGGPAKMFPRNEQVKNTRGKPKMLSKLSIYLLRGDGLSRNALKNSYEKRRTTEKVMTSTNSGSSLCRGSPQIQIQIQIQIHTFM